MIVAHAVEANCAPVATAKLHVTELFTFHGLDPKVSALTHEILTSLGQKHVLFLG